MNVFKKLKVIEVVNMMEINLDLFYIYWFKKEYVFYI